MKRFKILLLSSIVLASSLTPALACGNAARDYDNAVRNLIEKTEKILTLSTARDLLVDACKQLQLANGDFDKASKQLSAVKNSSELKTTASEMRVMATSLTDISDLLENFRRDEVDQKKIVADLQKVKIKLENALYLLDASDAQAALHAIWENKGACGYLNIPI